MVASWRLAQQDGRKYTLSLQFEFNILTLVFQHMHSIFNAVWVTTVCFQGRTGGGAKTCHVFTCSAKRDKLELLGGMEAELS